MINRASPTDKPNQKTTSSSKLKLLKDLPKLALTSGQTFNKIDDNEMMVPLPRVNTHRSMRFHGGVSEGLPKPLTAQSARNLTIRKGTIELNGVEMTAIMRLPFRNVLVVSPRMKSSPLKSPVKSSHNTDVFQRRRQIEEQDHIRVELQATLRRARYENGVKERDIELKSMESAKRQQIWLQMICAVAPMYVFRLQEVRARRQRILTTLIIPMVRRWLRVIRRRKEKAEYTYRVMHSAAKPTIEGLLQTPLFAGWGNANLARVIDVMTPRAFQQGECIAHEGDIGTEMFLLHRGTVEVVVRSKQVGVKKRNHENGFVVFTLTPPMVFGEFTVLCDEPRSATLFCKDDVQLWVISKEPFLHEVLQLPASAKQRIIVMAEDRRTANLMKLHRIKPDYLKSIPLFASWTSAAIDGFIQAARPKVVRQGSSVYDEGTKTDVVYVLSWGTVVFHKKDQQGIVVSEKKRSLGAGSVIGEVEVLFPEHRWATATAVTTCELWYVTKDVFMDLITLNPEWLFHGRKLGNEFRSRCLPPPTLELVQALFAISSPSTARHIISQMKPFVYGASEMITIAGQVIEDVIMLTSGKVRDKGLTALTDDVGNLFGLSDDEGGDRWLRNIKATTCCETWKINCKVLKSILKGDTK